MQTKWDSSTPKQKDGMLLVTGVMVDENHNSFHILVTTPNVPDTNRNDLLNFMERQVDERYRKVKIIFGDSNLPGDTSSQAREILLGKLTICLTPIQITSLTDYILEISDEIGNARAVLGSQFPYTVPNSERLSVRCHVHTGKVKMSAAGQSKIVEAPQKDMINGSSSTKVSWDILFECLNAQNYFTVAMTDYGTKTIS